MKNKGLFFSLLVIVSLFIQSCKPTPPKPPTTPPPAEEPKPTEHPPSEETAPVEAPVKESMEEEEPVSLETDSPQDAIKKIQRDYLKFLHASMEAAMAENDLEKTDKIRKEMIKAVNELNALEKKEQTPSEPEESSEQPTEENPPTSQVEPSQTESQEITPATEESTPEPTPAEETKAETEKDVASEDSKTLKPIKYKILIDAIPKTSSKRAEYETYEEISLRIKLANQNLKDPTGPITLYYFILGKGTRNSNEYRLLDSGEKEIELGNSAKDRFFEYTSDTYNNKYSMGSGPLNFKYEAWYVALADSEGNLIASKSNKPQFDDFNKFMNLKQGMFYDKSLDPLPYKNKY